MMTKELEKARRSIGARRNPETANAIREAAEAVLLEAGYAGFSIEAVARRARAGKPTIYRWWPSKAALLLDVYQRQKRDIDHGDSGPIEEDMFRLIKSLFRTWRNTPAGSIFRSVVAEAQSDENAAAALAEYSRERRAHIARTMESAKERGEIAAGVDLLVTADLLSSYAWSHLLTNRLDENDETIRAAIRCIVRGILAEDARRT